MLKLRYRWSVVAEQFVKLEPRASLLIVLVMARLVQMPRLLRGAIDLGTRKFAGNLAPFATLSENVFERPASADLSWYWGNMSRGLRLSACPSPVRQHSGPRDGRGNRPPFD